MTIFGLNMMVKSGLEKIILKFHVPLQRYLLTSQANSALLGRFFCTGPQQLWRGTWNFKIIFSRPLFTIIFKPKMVISRLKILVTCSSCSRWCGLCIRMTLKSFLLTEPYCNPSFQYYSPLSIDLMSSFSRNKSSKTFSDCFEKLDISARISGILIGELAVTNWHSQNLADFSFGYP